MSHGSSAADRGTGHNSPSLDERLLAPTKSCPVFSSNNEAQSSLWRVSAPSLKPPPSPHSPANRVPFPVNREPCRQKRRPPHAKRHARPFSGHTCLSATPREASRQAIALAFRDTLVAFHDTARALCDSTAARSAVDATGRHTR